MLSRVLLLALAVTAVFADEDSPSHRVTCNEATHLKTLRLADLTGNWVVVESVNFNDGHPYTPEDDSRPSTCIYAKVHDIHETDFKATLESHVPGKDMVAEEISLTAIGEDHGRLSLRSSLHDRENWEFLVLAEDPAKYLVYMMCLPPNEAGERLPARVNLLARHADHSDHESISQDEEIAIERRIGEQLHLTASGIKPVKFSHDCWASYAEPTPAA